ncbi:hypothetical protein E0I26_08925 [Flavobacterium rhamnosiphilum]|uniref:Uncharacterized protein n=1 Tax=Flavobacterium rhamnosiphilum TaxID=2541724 RepID=A0A4V2Z9E2_9FLAO|nr:hypothetical protein [Flavobacterium rhamnosiphilum]TDE44478.1 hypothetical protein E0I26_08925 [Flavobacterium rhamnosiphilum]
MTKRIKTGGRTVGTVNKTTAETKELLQKIVGNELDNISDLLDKLEPKDRFDAVIKLLPYLIPKQNYIEIETEIKQKPIDLSLMTTAELIERAKAINKLDE